MERKTRAQLAIERALNDAKLNEVENPTVSDFVEKIVSLSTQAESAYNKGQEVVAEYYFMETAKVASAAVQFARHA